MLDATVAFTVFSLSLSLLAKGLVDNNRKLAFCAGVGLFITVAMTYQYITFIPFFILLSILFYNGAAVTFISTFTLAFGAWLLKYYNSLFTGLIHTASGVDMNKSGNIIDFVRAAVSSFKVPDVFAGLYYNIAYLILPAIIFGIRSKKFALFFINCLIP